MNINSESEYHQYQRNISFIGNIYRKYFLHPRIGFHLIPGKILDIGCGLGDFIARYPSTRAFGVETNSLNVDYAKSRRLNVFSIDTSGILPFPSNTFSNIILDNVLEHIQEPRVLLEEIFRVLVPGGRVIIGVPGEKGFAYDPDHKVYYDKSSLCALMNLYKFHYVKCFYTPAPVMSWSKTMRQFCLYAIFIKPLN